jgi:hypothetical protein
VSTARLCGAAAALLAVLARAASAPGQELTEDGALVLRRFLDRPDEPVVRYEGRWRLEAENPRWSLKGWLVAGVKLDPATGFEYSAMDEGGSERIRRHLRELLERERQAHATGQAARSSLTVDNYEITAADPAEDGYRLALRPRRREDRLVEGFLVVRAADAELLRLEGRLAKRPSFWTREVRIVREYGRAAGQRVPLTQFTSARMLLAGTSRLRIAFEYDSVNGFEVSREAAGARVPDTR